VRKTRDLPGVSPAQILRPDAGLPCGFPHDRLFERPGIRRALTM
jgi:hypothetical protein